MPKLAVVIGRFQPVHRSHLLSLITRGTNQDAVLILLGSALATPTPKNPFTWEFRKEMILAGCKELGIPTENLQFAPLRDTPDDATWVAEVLRVVSQELQPGYQPVLVGTSKDASSYYLKLFPNWETDVCPPETETATVSATQIREALYKGDLDSVSNILPSSVRALLEGWLQTPEGQQILQSTK